MEILFKNIGSEHTVAGYGACCGHHAQALSTFTGDWRSELLVTPEPRTQSSLVWRFGILVVACLHWVSVVGLFPPKALASFQQLTERKPTGFELWGESPGACEGWHTALVSPYVCGSLILNNKNYRDRWIDRLWKKGIFLFLFFLQLVLLMTLIFLRLEHRSSI